MTQAKPRFNTFSEYLSYSDENQTEGRLQLIDGELIELPPESRLNSTIAVRILELLFFKVGAPAQRGLQPSFATSLLIALLQAGVAVELIHPGKCEVQVPVLQPRDAANRYPDLVVLREEHLVLTQRRLTITLDMPPPLLIVEVVSPGKTNRDRDFMNKRAQYAAIGVMEYWIVDPKAQTVLVLQLSEQGYQDVGQFLADDSLPV